MNIILYYWWIRTPSRVETKYTLYRYPSDTSDTDRKPYSNWNTSLAHIRSLYLPSICE